LASNRVRAVNFFSNTRTLRNAKSWKGGGIRIPERGPNLDERMDLVPDGIIDESDLAAFAEYLGRTS